MSPEAHEIKNDPRFAKNWLLSPSNQHKLHDLHKNELLLLIKDSFNHKHLDPDSKKNSF